MTYSEILALLQTAPHFTATSWDIDIYVDDYEADLRVVYRVQHELMRVDIARLHQYDPDKHVWREYQSRDREEIPNKRGLSKLKKWLAELNTKHYGYPCPRMASYYLGSKGVRTHV